MMERIYTSGHKIQEYTTTPNGMGGFTKTWTDKHTISGYLRTLSGDERLSADKVQLYSTHRFYCGLIAVDESMRYIDTNNKIYDIKLVDKKKAGNIEFLQIDVEFSGEVYEGEDEE